MALEEMIISRKTRTEVLVAASAAHAEEVGEAAARTLKKLLGENARFPSPTQLIKTLAASLIVQSQVLDDTNRSDGDDRRANKPLRQRRAASLKELGARMTEVRNTLLTAYDSAVLTQFEMSKALPTSNTTKMLLLSEAFVANAESVLRQAKPKTGLKVDVAHLINLVQEPSAALAEVQAALREEDQAARRSKLAKKKAIAAFDQHYVAVVTILDGVFRLGNHTALAESIRPTVRRRSRKKVTGVKPTPPAARGDSSPGAAGPKAEVKGESDTQPDAPAAEVAPKLVK